MKPKAEHRRTWEGTLGRFRGSRSTAGGWPELLLVPTGLREVEGATRMYQRGYWFRDARTDEAVSYHELSELVPGAVVFHVAGTSYRSDALQSPAFQPGQPVLLVPEPTNPYDKNAVAVWDGVHRAQAGYVPRALAPQVSNALRGRERFSAVCHFEFVTDRRRVGLSVLFAPTTFVQSLIVEPGTRG
jgi:hypothetical protein